VRILYLAAAIVVISLTGCGGTAIDTPAPIASTRVSAVTTTAPNNEIAHDDSAVPRQDTTTTVPASPQPSVLTTTTQILKPTTTTAQQPSTTVAASTTAPEIDYDEPTPGFESEEPNNNDNQFITYEPNA